MPILSMRLLLRIFILGLAYFVGGKLGLSMPYIGSSITLFWPSSGIALAGLLIWGFSCWPGIFLAALAITSTTGDLAFSSAVLIAAGNTVGAVTAAWLLKRAGVLHQQFERGRNIVALTVIGPACMVINASVGIFALSIDQQIPSAMFVRAWLNWWLGDAVGVLIMTPLLLVWSLHKPFVRRTLRSHVEFALSLALCGALAWLVFGMRFSLGYLHLSLAFLVFPPLIWAGLRFNARGATLAAFLISVIAVWGTAKGSGPFIEGTSQVDQLALCIFVLTNALLSMQVIGVQAFRRQAERVLHDNETRLRLAMAAANQGLWDVNVQTGVATVSPEYALMLGYDPESFVETRERWRERLHPDDRDAVYRIYQDYVAGRLEDYRVEFRQQTRQGQWKWILSMGKMVEWDAQGQPLRMIGTYTDISDGKARENALRQSQDALNQAQAIARLGSWQLDVENNMLVWSDEIFRIFAVIDNKPMSYADFLAHVVPEDRDLVDRAWQAALRGAPYDIEHRINAAGTIKWVRERAQIHFDDSGKPVSALGTVQDISARKATEIQLKQSRILLRQVIDATPDWIFVKDRSYRFVLVNKAFAQAQDLSPEQMLGKADTEIWSVDLRLGEPYEGRGDFHADDDLVFSGEIVHNLSDWVTLADGRLRRFDTLKLPLRRDDGAIHGVLGYARDITDRLELEDKYRNLVEQIPAVTYIAALEPVGHTLYVSPQIQNQLGFTAQEWMDDPGLWQRLLHPEDRSRVLAEITDSGFGSASTYLEYRLFRRDNSIAWVADYAVRIKHADHQHACIQGVMLDISQRKQTEQALRQALDELRIAEKQQRELHALAEREQSRMSALLAAMSIGILFEDNQHCVEYVNPAFLRMWLIGEHDDLRGLTTRTVLERSAERFARPANASRYVLNVMNTHEISERFELELSDGRMLTQLSYPVTDNEGRVLGRLWVYEDITRERQTAQQLLYLAERDPLTGLYNRHRFQEQLENLIAGTLRSHARFALLYFDLDDFKYINDTFGHSTGDTVLVRAAGEVSSVIRHIEIFARLGGDEFAILSNIHPGDDISVLPSRIVSAIASIPLRFRGTNIRLTSSIGVAIFPEHGETAEDLVAHADAAMYQAKSQGKNTWAIYDPARDASENMMVRMSWRDRIAQALDQGLFELHFQGVYATADRCLRHAEVLIRMHDAEQPEQLIMPGQFIPYAEKTGQILDIDRWVIRRSIELLAAHDNLPPLAINISGRSFDEPDLPRYTRSLLMEHRVDPGRLIIELTETAAVSDIQDAQRFIEAIHQAGCIVCLDDFGSGFSTFGYLKYLEVEVLKIDGAFISDLANNRENQIFVKAMVEVAKALGKMTVAEYVEDEATFESVRRLGIDLAQGYCFGRPNNNLPCE
jgi:diguanylate cyclase (GGDEF)-like protein/PAS domain S-box-containing protein